MFTDKYCYYMKEETTYTHSRVSAMELDLLTEGALEAWYSVTNFTRISGKSVQDQARASLNLSTFSVMAFIFLAIGAYIYRRRIHEKHAYKPVNAHEENVEGES